VQDGFNLRAGRGLSEFEALERFVARVICNLPFRRDRFISGWQYALSAPGQSGNPVDIADIGQYAEGRRQHSPCEFKWANPDRRQRGSLVRFSPAASFNDRGGNVVMGAGFNNTNFSIMKNIELSEKIGIPFRGEAFDLFNHANIGQPGNVIDTPGFGRITSTHFPTGESRSSRRLQLGPKLIF
jgi:hypothetical protein